MIVSIGALEVIDVAEIGRADGSVGAVRVDEMQASVTDPPCLVRRLRDGKALGDGKRMSDVPHRRGRNKHTESQKGGERHSLSLLPPNTTQSFCDVSRRRPHQCSDFTPGRRRDARAAPRSSLQRCRHAGVAQPSQPSIGAFAERKSEWESRRRAFRRPIPHFGRRP